MIAGSFRCYVPQTVHDHGSAKLEGSRRGMGGGGMTGETFTRTLRSRFGQGVHESALRRARGLGVLWLVGLEGMARAGTRVRAARGVPVRAKRGAGGRDARGLGGGVAGGGLD